jgi:hypothetical protein
VIAADTAVLHIFGGVIAADTAVLLALTSSCSEICYSEYIY